MDMLFFLLCGAALLGVLLGLIHPPLVFGRVKGATRKQVLRWYGTAALVCFIGFVAALPPAPQPVQSQAEQAAPTPAKPEPAVPTAAAAKQAEEVKKQAEANREKIAQETEASMAALVAKREEAKQPETPAVDAPKLAEEQAAKENAEAQAKEAKKQAEAEAAREAETKAARARAEVEQAQQAQSRAREADKAKVRAFEKELHGYDAVSSLFMENAKAMTRQLGKDASLGDLYQALKQARQYAQAGANEVLKLRVPDVPEPVAAALKEAKEASWQMLLGRKDALDAFMDWLDSRKPSDQAKMQEESNFSTLQAAKCVESILKAKSRAGFTEQEIDADLKAYGGDTPKQANPAKSKRHK